MKGLPSELHVNLKSKQIAVHRPISVSLHCCPLLYRGVKLEVLQAVPVGETVTRCHRMFTARKKNSKSQRTVDLQVFNQSAVCETHHIQYAFHQETLVASGNTTIVDASNRYHSVPIRKDLRLTMPILPWCLY